MGWASLFVAMRYIHPSDRVLEAISLLSGHNSGYRDDTRNLEGRVQRSELVGVAGDVLVSAAGFEPATHALKEYPAVIAGLGATGSNLRTERELPHSLASSALSCQYLQLPP